MSRRDHRHLGGIPGHAAPAPLRELSEALFELADRLASQSELNPAGAGRRPAAQRARDDRRFRDAFTCSPDAVDG
jgi:hypothetical protein